MHSGYVAVIGRANAGKSTLINVLVGEKVTIVSPKPQTTRNAILGVLTKEEYQIVFVDTPGLYRAKTALSAAMNKTALSAARDVDLVLFVHDGHAGLKDEDVELIKRYSSGDIPVLIAYTKIDIMPRENIPGDIKKLYEAGVECDVFPVSARKGINVKRLEEAIAAALPEGERVISDDIVSDKSEKFMIAEIMREKILLKYDKEIPHGVAVVVNTFKKQENGVYDINLDVVCEKPNHKAIIIGKQGSALKQVSSFARGDMEKFLGAKVFLTVYVKVKEGWRDRPDLMRDYGYDTKKEL